MVGVPVSTAGTHRPVDTVDLRDRLEDLAGQVGEHAEEWLAKLRTATEQVDDVRTHGPSR